VDLNTAKERAISYQRFKMEGIDVGTKGRKNVKKPKKKVPGKKEQKT
jgi:hypothetical protein